MNTCDVNYLDADSLLPPRKRLLAGLKRQTSDVNSPGPSTSNGTGSDYDPRLSDLVRSHLSNPNLSNEQIVEASESAALEAANIAKAARAKAEEKAAKAAVAVAAAKNALDFLATLSEETSSKEKSPKKNKMKKHMPVQALYNKKKGYTNGKTDEEVARNLHRVINSSPRISKNSGPDLKNQKHKRVKNSTSGNMNNGVLIAEGIRTEKITSSGNGIVGVNGEGPVKEVDMIVVDLNGSKSDRGDNLSSISGEKHLPIKADNLKLVNGVSIESLDSDGKKKGKMKQKKLPLSVCSFRDQTSPKDDLKSRDEQPLFSVGTSGDCLTPVERKTMWKCQSFKAPASVKQNKVMQS